jgi:stage III sporulation protein AG
MRRERLKWGKLELEGRQKKPIHIPENLTEKLRELLMKKDHLVITLLVGILLLVIALPVSDKNRDSPERMAERGDASLREETAGFDTAEYADYLEQKLAAALSRVKGVGRTEVMVTLASGTQRVVEKDTISENESVQETDSQGGSRSTIHSSSSQATVYAGAQDSGREGEPYVTKELTPVVEGVIVIAEGGDDAVTIQNITEAVQALFEIDTHKIKVMKSN